MEITSFLDYDKITDTLMYFDNNITLNFVVQLKRNNKGGVKVPFHSEYVYRVFQDEGLSIKRNFRYYFAINDAKDFNNSIMIQIQDLFLLKIMMENNIIPWYIGSSRIYSMNDDNNLIIKKKFNVESFPLSDYKYLSFSPIVINYTDNTSKEGVRICFNNNDNFVDITINKFLEFYNYIASTDVYNAAIGLVNYVKMQPYGMNIKNTSDFSDIKEGISSRKGSSSRPSNISGKKRANDFFNNL